MDTLCDLLEFFSGLLKRLEAIMLGVEGSSVHQGREQVEQV